MWRMPNEIEVMIVLRPTVGDGTAIATRQVFPLRETRRHAEFLFSFSAADRSPITWIGCGG
jgi:hypothetical protein